MAVTTALRTASAEAVRVPLLIDGAWRFAASEYDVIDPCRGEVVARGPEASAADLDAALTSAVAAKAIAAAVPGYRRAALIRRVIDLLDERAEIVAETITRETGKALKDARAEVARSRETLMLSAEEAVRIEGEHVPLDATAMGAGKIAMLQSRPFSTVSISSSLLAASRSSRVWSRSASTAAAR
jgi:acyl-CoA reductase-like NAD-dependent aldehyde dehydrogenase